MLSLLIWLLSPPVTLPRLKLSNECISDLVTFSLTLLHSLHLVYAVIQASVIIIVIICFGLLVLQPETTAPTPRPQSLLCQCCLHHILCLPGDILLYIF